MSGDREIYWTMIRGDMGCGECIHYNNKIIGDPCDKYKEAKAITDEEVGCYRRTLATPSRKQ